MTKFRFDFQDLIVLLGIRPPANRVAYIGQSFPGRPPVIFVLVAFTLLAHLSKRFWMSVAYAVHKTCYTDRRDLEKRETGCALSRGIYRFALCSTIISFNR